MVLYQRGEGWSYITFPSIGRKDTAYRFHSFSTALWDSAYRMAGALSAKDGEYYTGGDELCQHGPMRAVCAVNAEDYWRSLAFAIGAAVGAGAIAEDGFASLVGSVQRDVPSRELCTFAFSIVHKPGKTQYYNVHDYKVSTRDSLRHDKRWERVTEDHNGTPTSAFSIIRQRMDSVFTGETYALWMAMQENAPSDAYVRGGAEVWLKAWITEGDHWKSAWRTADEAWLGLLSMSRGVWQVWRAGLDAVRYREGIERERADSETDKAKALPAVPCAEEG